MSWAASRRFVILLIGGGVVAFGIVVLIATFSKAPSCTDGVQNQGEAGIDCGSPCAYLCSAQVQAPTVLFTKAISSSGRTSIIASVENKNMNAAVKNILYHVQLYGAGRSLIQEISGTLDLPPGTTVPVFIPNVTLGGQSVTNAFLTVDASSPRWFSMPIDPRVVPLVSNIQPGGTPRAPRIEALLTNPSIMPLSNVRVIVMVRDAQGTVIAASQTIVPLIPAQGQATAIFTWNTAFSGVPASAQVGPVIPLP